MVLLRYQPTIGEVPMEPTIDVNGDIVYVQLTERAYVHLCRQLSDDRRKFSFGQGWVRDLDSHRVMDGYHPSGWWQFTVSELHKFFGDQPLADMLIDAAIHLSNPLAAALNNTDAS